MLHCHVAMGWVKQHQLQKVMLALVRDIGLAQTSVRVVQRVLLFWFLFFWKISRSCDYASSRSFHCLLQFRFNLIDFLKPLPLLRRFRRSWRFCMILFFLFSPLSFCFGPIRFWLALWIVSEFRCCRYRRSDWWVGLWAEGEMMHVVDSSATYKLHFRPFNHSYDHKLYTHIIRITKTMKAVT